MSFFITKYLLPRRLFWGGVIIVLLSFWTQFQPVYVGRGGFPTPTAHSSPGHHLGVLQFNSVLTLPTWSQVPDMKGLPPETVPPPTHNPVLLTNHYREEGPTNTSLDWLEQLIEPREAFTY